MTDPTLLKNQIELNEKMGRISEIVERHDTVTFPEIMSTLKRIESKHNQDYTQYVASREDANKRLIPLEADLEARRNFKEGAKKGFGSIGWDMIKMGTIAIIGYALSFIKH